MIADTANVDYRFIVLPGGKTNFRFPFPFAANKPKFVVFVFRL
jgi:hypothetical protein